MIKIKIIVLLCLINTGTALCQASYMKLDSLSSFIAQSQKSNDGKKYTEENGTEYELSFADENFYVLSHNRLASFSEYRKYGDKELLYVTENIDLSKATALEATGDNGQCLKLLFPPGYLKTQVYETGNLVETTSPESLKFYLLSEPYLDLEKVYGDKFKTIAALCHLMQVEKGLIDAAGIEKLNAHFAEIVNDLNSDLSNYDRFFEAYKDAPQKPLYYNEVMDWYTYRQKEIDRVIHFADSLSSIYKFKPYLSKSKFLEHNQDAASTVLSPVSTNNTLPFPIISYSRDINTKKNRNIYIKGFNGYITNNADKVLSCGWFTENEKLTFTDHQEVFEKIKRQVQMRVPPGFIEYPKKDETFQIERIVINVPYPGRKEIAYYITLKLMNVYGSHNIYIGFSTEKVLAEW